MTALDPQARAVLDARKGQPPASSLPIDEARRRMREVYAEPERPKIAEVRDEVIPGPAGGLRVRLYRPRVDAPLPLVLYFHGGGWVVDDLDTHDRSSALIATYADAAVLSVDYRRSPENRYPAAVEDAMTALEWVRDHAEELGTDGRIVVAGDSAGGAIAAAAVLLARDRGVPALTAQLLFYPVTDHPDAGTASYREYATGYSLDRAFMDWAWSSYLPETWSRDDPYLFPLRADMAGLPPSYIVTAEFDPLRDEGLAYADRLADAGVEVHRWHAADQMHGFSMLTHKIDHARAIVIEVATALKEGLRGD